MRRHHYIAEVECCIKSKMKNILGLLSTYRFGEINYLRIALLTFPNLDLSQLPSHSMLFKSHTFTQRFFKSEHAHAVHLSHVCLVKQILLLFERDGDKQFRTV